ncbi:acyltransferase [Desulfomonile tiedjei]|uniref:Acetyltransferase (Isoleucine patch superfamily) n=1 Tax=Desulfomonile tiedjei (strain ATCC 49306 / DSM 6799 / DCB-1) TaxID=706587 RepID=I4CCA5_DESTA|nr:acyltransferase [Desulfomonile tiedjei]AFM27196.1 acetyltransferase (isoleucine patch superfamily) [Desulfomonile tiedjei DSM 6799]
MNKILIMYSWFVFVMTFWMPDIPHIMRFRGWLLGLAMNRKGKNFQVSNAAIIRGLENLSVGNDVYCASGVVILAARDIRIDDEVMVAFHSVIIDGNHRSQAGSYRFGRSIRKPVRIGRGTWIGANCTICPGVSIGSNVAIAANSAVVEDLPSDVTAGGVPARVIKDNSEFNFSDYEEVIYSR